MPTSVPLSLYPVVTLQDRYGGCYSGGAWIAIANADHSHGEGSRIGWALANGPNGGDPEAAGFWRPAPDWAAWGETPDAAVDALISKYSSPSRG